MRKINLSNFTLATSLTARDINGRIVLNMIRTHQPLSRADVARLTGLQRSTVSLIADELIEAGWVIEGEYGKLPRGRRPIFLQLNSDSMGIIGVNVQRSETNIALGNLDGNILARKDIPSNPDYPQFLESLALAIRELQSDRPDLSIGGIGVAVPGRIRTGTNRLAFASGFNWRDLDLKNDLEKAMNLPVEVENAANSVALAESYFGEQKKGYENLVALTISDGVGTGIITHGHLVRGATGMAGEFGHVKIREAGPKCACGGEGCLEAIISNTAALKNWREKNNTPAEARNDRTDYLQLLKDFRKGDPEATAVMEDVADGIGAGLAMINSALEPNIILVVGDITEVWDLLAPRIELAMDQQWHVPGAVRIVPAKKNIETRLCGSLALVLHRYFGAPEVA